MSWRARARVGFRAAPLSNKYDLAFHLTELQLISPFVTALRCQPENGGPTAAPWCLAAEGSLVAVGCGTGLVEVRCFFLSFSFSFLFFFFFFFFEICLLS
jgi:hypothetical protein